jgi:Caspase domain/WD domain, G-beta repeat
MAKVALLIGVSEYEPGWNPLPAAVKDLDAMKEVLLHPEMGGFAESDILLLKNPNRQQIEESIETLFSNRHRDDLVVLFFSGHGIKDDAGRLYLGASKTRKTPQGDLVRSSAVAANLVHENMSRSRSKRQVVILDSCFSGAFAEGLAAKDDGTVDIRTQLGGEGRAVLTSSSSTQYSFEQEGEELSLYTRFLVEGIKTGAADLDGDDVISIDELHEYASRKVREVKPELKPEIYAMREGFKILLSKVPQGDPRQKYQKEVARCGKRGELTIVSRSILDTWRAKLGLSVEEAKVLEDEVLEPYRREFQQKLQEYERVVTEVMERDASINNDTRLELQNLQIVLELRQEDTVPIKAKVAAYLKIRKQNLKTYKEAFSDALRQEYPLSDATRLRLQQMRQQLELSDADVSPIESQIMAEVETYRRNLQEYEQAIVAATQQEYPLNKIRRNELRQQQERLGLTDVEVAPIEAKVTTQVETYQQKLQQYEKAFINATQRKHPLGEVNRTQLTQMWQTLALSERDVKEIETPILSQIEIYRVNLRQYEQEFTEATEQQYPLSVAKRSELRQRQQALSLNDEDVVPIENQITALIEEHVQKLQQYEQVFSDSIKFELPVREATRKELQRLQQLLSLSDETVAIIETRLLDSKKAENEREQVEKESRAQEIPQVRERDAFIGVVHQLAKHKRQRQERTKQVSRAVPPKQPLESKQLEKVHAEPISTPIPDYDSASSENTEVAIKRRELLKWGGFGGGGLVLALIGNWIQNFSHTSQDKKSDALDGLNGVVSSVAFSPDGKILASGSWGGSVKIWNLLNGELIYNLAASSWSVLTIAISPDSKTLACGNGYGPKIESETLKLWNLKTGKLIRSISASAKIRSVVFNRDGNILISGGEDSFIKLWDINNGQLLKTLSGHSGIVTSLAISSDGNYLVSGSIDKTLKLWDIRTKKLIRTFSGNSGAINSVSISTRDNRIASGTSDKKIKFWDFSTGKLINTYLGYSSSINSVAISPDGQSVISNGSNDPLGRVVKVLRITGQVILTLYGHSEEVNAIAVSPDSKIIASGSRDGSVKIWSLSTGKLMRSL